MNDNIFRLLVILMYVFVVVWVVAQHFVHKYRERKLSETKNARKSNSTLDGTHKVRFSDIRSHRMFSANDDGYDKYTIAKSFEEILEIFLSVSPTTLQTILKVQEALILIQSEFTKNALDNSRIDSILDSILVALNQLEEASNSLIHKMVEVHNENRLFDGEVKVNEQLIDQYISIVNSLEEVHINYTYYFQRLLKNFQDRYPEKVPTFILVSEKLIYVLYVVITCCSTRLDRQIHAYRIEKGDASVDD